MECHCGSSTRFPRPGLSSHGRSKRITCVTHPFSPLISPSRADLHSNASTTTRTNLLTTSRCTGPLWRRRSPTALMCSPMSSLMSLGLVMSMQIPYFCCPELPDGLVLCHFMIGLIALLEGLRIFSNHKIVAMTNLIIIIKVRQRNASILRASNLGCNSEPKLPRHRIHSPTRQRPPSHRSLMALLLLAASILRQPTKERHISDIQTSILRQPPTESLFRRGKIASRRRLANIPYRIRRLCLSDSRQPAAEYRGVRSNPRRRRSIHAIVGLLGRQFLPSCYFTDSY